jgi:hypothetical protein
MSNWTTAPDACTLPTADRPGRFEAFDALFRQHLLSVDRVTPTTSTFVLTPGPEPAGAAAELAAREAACCSFFAFTLQVRDDHLELTVAVPSKFGPVLAGLSDQADAALGRS